MRCFVVCAALSLLSPIWLGAGEARAETAGELSFSSLLKRFAAVPGLQAEFREEKRVALMDAPLVSEGTLHFTPPGKLARHVRTPHPSTIVIGDGRLRFSDGRKVREVNLRRNPVVRHLVEGVVLLLSGDEAAVRETYDVALTPRPDVAADGWEVVLTPRPRAMRRVLRDVRIIGVGVAFREMRVREVSGDETITTYSNVNAARRYTRAEQERIFSLPAP